MKLPVIILNWNGWEDTSKCLQALNDQPEVGEVWLVDNGSSVDRSGECLRIMPGLRILQLGENYGWAGGYNRALKIASSEGYELVYLMNNDTIPAPGFLAEASRVMAQDSQFAAVGSIIVYSDKEWIRFDGQYYGRQERRFRPVRTGEWRLANEVNGAGMLVRLSVMETSGWFDERFFCYWEEVDWCLRVRDHGWRIAIAPASVIFHAGERSNTNANSEYYRFRNQFLLRTRYKDRIEFKNKFQMARSALGAACGHLHKRNRTGYEAMLAALRDGWFKRFGKRQHVPLAPPWLILGAGCACLLWIKRILRKAR